MIYAFIRSYIGGLGRAIMDFYIANSLFINAIVLIYALFVYFSHMSYYSAYRSVLEMLGFNPEKPTKSQKEKLFKGKVDFSGIDWTAARQAFRFPFIAAPRAVLIRLKTNTTLQKLFSEEKIKALLSSDKSDK